MLCTLAGHSTPCAVCAVFFQRRKAVSSAEGRKQTKKDCTSIAALVTYWADSERQALVRADAIQGIPWPKTLIGIGRESNQALLDFDRVRVYANCLGASGIGEGKGFFKFQVQDTKE